MTATATRPIGDLLARTRARADQRSAANESSYVALIHAAAEGKELDPEKLLKQLDALGRDVGEFQIAVEALAQRFDLKAVSDRLPELVRERAAIEKQVHQRNEDLQAAILKAEAAHDAAVTPLLTRNAALVAAIAAAENAQNRLRGTCSPDQLDAVHTSQRAAAEQERKVERALRDLQAMKESLPGATKSVEHWKGLSANLPCDGPGDVQQLKDSLRFRAEALADLERLNLAITHAEENQLPAARAELARLQGEAQAAQDLMLLP